MIKVETVFDKEFTLTLQIILVGCIALCVSSMYMRFIKNYKIKKKIRGMTEAAAEYTPAQFMWLRRQRFGTKNKKSYALEHNFPGVYILLNKTKNMYYVGQGKEVINRINCHFTGKGNGDVYHDYKSGDQFAIRIIPLKKSGFKTLNELEKNTIMTYDSYYEGYNKTRGNKG